jgi:two-component system alkaline phosphatase synthesis response regulator PhoP
MFQPNNKYLIINDGDNITEKLKSALHKEGYRIFVSDEEQSNNSSKQSITINDLIIDRETYLVHFKGRKIIFPKKEFELLYLLASNPEKVFNRDVIAQKIWNKSKIEKGDRTLDVHIRMIRKKLNEEYITTIKGVGYKLIKS